MAKVKLKSISCNPTKKLKKQNDKINPGSFTFKKVNDYYRDMLKLKFMAGSCPLEICVNFALLT